MTNKDIFSIGNAENSLEYLRDTDNEIASLKARLSSLEKTEKTILAGEMLDTDNALKVGERDATARTSTAYREWLSEHDNAVLEYHTLLAKRTTKALFLELFRTIFSARIRGNV